MKALLATCLYTIVQLRKDHLAFPFLTGILLTMGFSYLASGWTIEDFEKVLMDFTAFILHIFGGSVTIIWGTRLFNTFSDENPSLEFDLAAPLSRSHWLAGRFLGFCLSLSLFGLLIFSVWYLMFHAFDFRFFSWKMLWMFGAQITGWVSLAALTCFVSSFLRRNTALFSAFGLWICGLLAPLGEINSAPENITGTSGASWLATFWNFQIFNVVPETVSGMTQVSYTLTYGLGLCVALVGFGCLIFSRRNLYS